VTIRRMNDQMAYGIDQQGGKGQAAFTTDKCPTICSDSHGTPHAVCFQTGHTKGNGSGVNTENVAYTLESVTGGGMAVMDIFRLDSESSNSMKSSNPNSGCHRENVCHTIDATIPNPSKGQGGMAIVEMS